ncbi:MAG: DNA translocase FtsK 4TM domain-containing protein [Candidatus Rokubacteria bacterium]|nr:DNA translocase FtsK 4TM domain-containing protein [Candidatus Rokubacteria bacterium]
MATIVTADDKPKPPPRRARKRKEARRWLREVRGILLLALAGFGLIALATFDPLVPAGEQHAPVGPVGTLLGWALFRGFGYAAYLFPLLLAVIGLSVFVRPLVTRGWPPAVGLVVLLTSATGLLAQTSSALSDAAAPQPVLHGGLAGWAVAEGLRASVGAVGAWLLPLVGVPIGVLFLTQVSYGALSRVASARIARWRRRKPARAPRAAAVAVESSPAAEAVAPAVEIAEETVADTQPPPPVVVEPRKRASSGLSWQETFDFGKGGAEAFQLPPIGLLHVPDSTEHKLSTEELQDNAETLRRKLQDFEVEGRIVQVSPGPIITSYEFEPAAGIKISRVVNLADDLALSLKAAAVRIVGPIPGRGTVAIEVPNPEAAMVYLREIFSSPDFAESKRRLPLALGKDVTGGPVVSDLTAMPHLLVAGATGTGKSVGLNAMICSILYKMTPAEVRFLMIDPKRLELSIYEGIPHLLAPVVTDAKEAAARLRWIVGKMDERYKLLQNKQVRNIEGYNKSVESAERLPYWIVVIDELADLMLVSVGDVQTALVRLAQIARAVGIHLIIATQRPSVDVVTGLIKANFPTRIAFQMASKVDSRTVLDANGAEQLLGRGDMIFVPPGANKQMRVHGAWVSDEEVKAVCEFLRTQGTAVYEEVKLLTAEEAAEGAQAERDDIYWDCVRLVIGQRAGSISFLQRRMGLGYPKAARFIDMMEQDRIIGPGQGAKPREILVGPDYLAKRGK